MHDPRSSARRRVIAGLGGAVAMVTAPRLLSEMLVPTPRQTAGPFYPDRLPLDTDNDLLRINDDDAQAAGDVTWVSGRILDASGRPLRGAQVEIWQVDRNGVYLHSGSGNREQRDARFQGYGRCMTGDNGEYVFRTVEAGALCVPHGAYPLRCSPPRQLGAIHHADVREGRAAQCA